MWPQLMYLALCFMSLGVAAAKHGQPREPWSFWGALVNLAIVLPLLWAGGFFSPFAAE